VVSVRTATRLDALAIATVIRSESFGFLVDPASEDAKRFFAALEQTALEKLMGDPTRLYFVAVENEAIVGMIMVRDKNYISQFFVAATHQGRGVGRLLWQHALATVVAAGATGEFSVSSSLAAEGIYARFGFARTGEPTAQNGFKFVPMQRAAAE
jgi:ribosomal protein S18 acetylase RimI-like enzyme